MTSYHLPLALVRALVFLASCISVLLELGLQDIKVEELTIFTIPIRLGKSFLTLIGEQQGHIIINLFAGTGGTRLGLERGGGKCLNARGSHAQKRRWQENLVE